MREKRNKNRKIEEFEKREEEELRRVSGRGLYHLNTASKIDKYITNVQMSTKVTIPQLGFLHDYFRMKFGWYYRWSLNKYSNLIHSAVLSVYMILVTGGFALASMSGWQISEIFQPLEYARAASIDISGACKQYDRSTNCADSETIKVAVNGTPAAQTGSTSSGSWSITGVTVNDNDVLTIWVDGVADGNEAVNVIKLGTAGNVTSAVLYERNLTLGASPNQTITNADLAQYDYTSSSNEDIFYQVETSNLTLPATGTQTANDQVLYIIGGNTYRPDSSSGRTNTMPNLVIASGAVLTGDNNTFVLTADGTPFTKTGTFTYNTSTFRYTGENDTTITAADYYNLETKPSAGGGSGGWTVTGAGDSSFNGDYTESGTMNGQSKYTNGSKWLFYNQHDMPEPGYEWALASSASNCMDAFMCTAYYQYPGDTTPSASTWYTGMDGSGSAPTLSVLAGGYTYTLAAGTFNIHNNYVNGDATHGIVTDATANDPTVNIDGAFSNSANGTFVASNSATFSVGGNFTNSQTFTHSSGTLTLDGSDTQSINMGSSPLNNLTITNTTYAVSQSAATTLVGTLTINSNAIYYLNGQNITLTTLSNSGTFMLQGGESTVTITNKDTDSGTVEYIGSSTYTSLKYGNSYYDLKINGVSGSWTPNGDVTANSININAGTFDGSSRNITLSGSGTPFTVTGTFTPSTSTVIYTGASATNVTGTTYTNLKVNHTGTTFTAANDIAVTGVFTIQAGTFDASNKTITLSGGGTPFVKTGTFTANSSTFKYTANSDTTVAAATYYNLETSPADAALGGYEVSGAGTSAYNGTYTANGTHNGQTSYTNGSKWLYYNYDAIMCMCYNWVLNGSVTDLNDVGMMADYYTGTTITDTWNYNVMSMNNPAPTVTQNSASANYTLASGTLTVGGNWTNGDGTHAANVNATTNDPTINISGNFSNAANSTFVASNSATFTISGDMSINSSSTFTHSSGALTLNGNGAQTITAGGTGSGHQLNNLTITNASASGVSFADSLTIVGTFTDTTASSKLTFASGSTYAFANININGQDTGTRVVMTGSGTWYFNVSQSSPSVSYVDVTNSNAGGGNNIDATVGCHDGTGNTNWTFTSAGITVSGTVYTAENKSTNIGANKTVAYIINGDGGSYTSTETDSNGAFSFSGVTVSANDPFLIYLSGETEKASFVTQVANSVTNLTGLELYTDHIILTHETAGPITNSIIAAATAATDFDNMISVDESNNATFTVYPSAETWILSGKTYTPGGDAYFGNFDILSGATFTPESNMVAINDTGTSFVIDGTFNEGSSTVFYQAIGGSNVAGTTYHDLLISQNGDTFTAIGSITVSGVLTIDTGTTFDGADETIILSGAGTPFVKTGTFTPSSSTIRYTGEDDTNITAANYWNLETKPPSGSAGAGWTVSGAGASTYNGDYIESGTYGSSSRPAYTDGTRWIFSDFADMPAQDYWCISTSKFDLGDPWMQCPYYSASASLPGTWYTGDPGNGGSDPPPTLSGLSGGYTYTLSSGAFTIDANFTNGDGTHGVILDADTNDPTISIDGNFVNSATATFIASASADFSVASDFTNSNKFTDSSGTLTLDGQALQTITTNGTDSNHDFYDLIITNASAGGVSFADSATVAGTFTNTTASSKVTFHSGSAYAFNALDIDGGSTGTRITLTSSSSGNAWNLTVSESSPTASNVAVKDSNANKDIDATTGGYDNTGNTHWLFPQSLNISGTVYTAEDGSSNIGANKTVALSIQGGTADTVETSSGGTYTFEDVSFSTNSIIMVYISGETEKGSTVTQAANGTSNITGLNIYTSHIVLAHNTAGPVTNSMLATADDVADSDCLISVDGSSVATFTDGNQVWIPADKTYTPGADIILHDLQVDGDLELGANSATLSGSWDSADGSFTSSGTVSFNNNSGTETLVTGGPGGSGGWTLSGAGDSSYNGAYSESGTMNGQPKYTNGSKWLYYNSYDMPEPGTAWALASSASNCMDPYMCTAYYQYPGNTDPSASSWYLGTDGSGSAPSIVATVVNGGVFTNITKSGNGTLQVVSDEIEIDGTLSIGSGSTFDINGQSLTLETMSNDGTFRLQGDETLNISTPDISSGTIEYSGSGTYSSLLMGDSYAGLTFNGSGTWSLDNNLAVSGVLNVNSGTFNANSYTITLSGSGTPFIVTGTFSEDSSTISYTGSSATNIAGTTYYNLILNHTGTTFTAAGDLMTRGTLTISNGEFDASDKTIDIAGSGTPFVNNGTFTASSSTVLYAGGGSSSVMAGTYNNLQFDNSGSDFEREITLSNSTGSELTNFQTKIALSTSNFSFANSTNDGRDIRIKDSDDSTDLNFYIDSWDQNGETAVIWVKVPSIPTTGATIYIHYGDSTLSSASSGANTFEFFDDFSTSYTTNWTKRANGTATWDSTNKYVTVGGNGDDQVVLYTTSASLSNFVLDIDYQVVSNYDVKVDYRLNTSTGAAYQALVGGWSNTQHATRELSDWTTYATPVTHAGSTDTNWHTLEVRANGTSMSTLVDDSTLSIDYTDSTLSSGAIGLTCGPTASVIFDNVIARKIASAEPGVLVGDETELAGTWTISGDTEVSGNLEITSGELNGSTYNITVGGSWNNQGTFNGGSSEVIFTGDPTIQGSSDFYDLTSEVPDQTLSFEAGETQTINGTWTVTGSSDHNIILQRYGESGQWNVDPAAYAISYATVSDSNNIAVAAIAPNNSTDGNNNTNWDFGGGGGSATISGTIYTAEDKSTNIGANKTIALSIGGAAATTVETTSGGEFSFTSVTVDTDNIVAIYVSGETEKASMVTQASGSGNITGLELYTGNIVLRHETAGPITNTLLATADNVADSDLLVSVDGSNVATFTSGNTVWVWTGKTYAPGAAVDAGGFNIDGTFTAGSSNITIHGSWDANTGSITSSGTTTFDGSSGTISIGSGGQSFNNVILDDGGGTATFRITTALDVNGTFTLTDGALDLDNNDPTLNIAGDITINGGSITKSSADSLVTLDGDLTYEDNVGVNLGDIQIGASPDTTDLSSDFTCDSLTIASGDIFNTHGYEIDSAGDITISSTASLDATDDGELDGTIINIAGDWSNSGTFTADTSEVVFDAGDTGHSLSGSMTSTSAFNDLTFDNASGDWTAANDIEVASVMDINAGEFDASNKTIIFSGAGTPFVKTGTFTPSSSTVKYTGNDATTITAASYNNLETSPSSTGFGSYVVTGAGIADYDGGYNQSGTWGGQPAYTNGIKWLFLASDQNSWALNTTKVNDKVLCDYYSTDSALPGSLGWSTSQGVNPPPSVSSGTASVTYTLASGTFSVGGDYVNGDGSHGVITDATANDPNLSIDGNFTNSSDESFIASDSGSFSVASSYTNSGYFTDSGGTLTLDGQGLQTITMGGTDTYHDLYDLEITNASASGVIFVDSLRVAGTFTDSTADSKLTFATGESYAFANIDISGSNGHNVIMTSDNAVPGTPSGSQWSFNVSQSSPSVSYVTVYDSDASSGNAITPVNSTNGGNNTNWLFGVTVSGTIYTAEDKSSNIGADKTVAVSVEGGSASTVETGAGGTFSFIKEISANDVIAIYISGETEKGSLVTQAADGSTDITGLEIYTSHTVLSHQTTGPMTNTLLATADDVSDSDLLVSVDGSSNATFTSGNEVWILGSKTYTPGANVTCGSLDVLSSAAFSPEANAVTFTDSGTPFVIDGTFNESTSSIIYTGAGATNVAGTTYNNLTVNHTGVSFTSTANITVKAVFTIQAGTFDASDDTLTLSGAGTPFVNSDTFTASSSTVKYTGEGDTNVTADDYNNLELKPSAETGEEGWFVDGAGSSAVDGLYTANGTSGGETSYTNGYSWLCGGGGWNIMDFCGGAWIAYTGTGSLPANPWSVAMGDSPAPSVEYVSPYYTYTLSAGTFNIAGNLINGDASNGVITDADTNDPVVSINGSFSNSTSAEFIASSSASLSVAGDFDNDSSATFTHSSGTVTFDGQGAQGITSGGDSLNNVVISNTSAAVSQADASSIAGALTINSNAIYDIAGQDITLGTLSNDGTFRLHGDESTFTITNKDTNSGTIEYTGTGNYASLLYGTAYYALKFSGSGTYAIASTTTVGGDTTIAGSTVNLGNNTAYLATTGTFYLTSGTFTIADQGAYRTKMTAGVYNQSNGTYTNGSFAYTDINGAYTVSGGTFTNKSYTYVSGDYSFTAGSYSCVGSPRFYLDGNNNAAINNSSANICGTLYNSKGATYTLTFNADITVASYTNSGLVNTNGHTITFNGGTFAGGGATYDNIVVDCSPLYLSGSATINGNMTLNSGRYVSYLSESQVTTFTNSARLVYAASNNYINSGIYSSYYLFKDDAATNLPTIGTIGGRVRIEADTKNINIPNSTFGGRVDVFNNGSSDRTLTLGTAGSQTLTFNSDLVVNTTSTGALNLAGNTWNPIVNITGSVSFAKSSTGVPSINFGTGLWSVGTNFNATNSSLTTTGSTLRFSGNVSQTLTCASQSFNNLTVTNASASGTTFADSCTALGTFTDTTANSKLTFHAGSTYAFANISLSGQAAGTKIVMVSSTPTSQWFLNVTQSSSQATFVNVTDSDALGGNSITALNSTNGGNNENWLFGVAISGTIYTAEDKSANIGANKTVAVSANGGAKTTVETTAGGAFTFSSVAVTTDYTVAIYLSGEAEKASYVTQIVDDTTTLTSLELYTGHIVITHHTAGPMTNTILSVADDAADSDLLFSIDGSSDATFASGNKIWIPSGKTYTPGGDVTCGSLEILSGGTFSPEGNTVTLTDSGTPFTVSGTFNEATSTVIYTGSSATNVTGTTYNNLSVSSGTYYSAPVNIANSGGTSLSDYQVKLELTSSNFNFAASTDDGRDIRFFNSDDSTALSFYIASWDQNAQTATIWVKVPAIPAIGTTIYIHYGNSGLASASSGDNTFLFFDDFSGASLDTSKWPAHVGESVGSGAVTLNTATNLDASTEDYIWATDYTVPIGSKVEMRNKIAASSGRYRFGITSARTTFYTNSINYLGIQLFSDNTTYTDLNAASTLTQTSAGAYDTDWHDYTFIWDTGTAKFYRDTTLLNSYTTNVPNGSATMHPYIRDDGQTDWVRVRKYAATEPTATIDTGGDCDMTAAGDITAKSVFTISSGTFDASNKTITLSGSGTPFVKTGTFTSSTSTIKYTGAGNTTVAVADYFNLETKPSADNAGVPYNYIFSGGTTNIGGDYTNGDGTNKASISAAFSQSGEIVNIDGDFNNSANATFIASSGADFSAASDFTNSGVFTDSGGTLTLDGQGLQTITAGGTDADHDFTNITVTNADSTDGIAFADSLTITGTFTDTTASSKLTFHALSTYAFANIDINGQDAGTEITMMSDDHANATEADRQWYFNVSQTSPQATFVNVTDSDALGGNAIIPITSTNGGNNENWLFNSAPSNTSLTFTNPYSGTAKTAVADDTTEWNFQAVVSDADGATDVNYVELHLANNSDNSQPYDSLKFRWTESTDTFSEEADTQNATTLTSTSNDSNASGNEWTIDFKIKFNSNFLNLTTDYSAEIYTLDDYSSSDTDNYSNIYNVDQLSISLSVDNGTIDFSNLSPGNVATATTITTVTCNHPNGYGLSISDGVPGGYSALLHTDGITRIADYVASILSPTLWSDYGLGITVYQATEKEAKWGSGTTENSVDNKYAGVPETPTLIHSKTGSPTVDDVTNIGYKVVLPNDQKTGSYEGDVTYTVTGTLN